MNRTKFSNPLNANPGTGNSMSPSPSSESVKGSVNRGNSPSSTTRDTKSQTNVGPDEVKGANTESEKLKRGVDNDRNADRNTVHGERRAG